LKRLAYSTGLFGFVADWPARFRCPSGWHGSAGWLDSAARLICSAPPNYLLVRSGSPAGSFVSVARLFGSAPPT